VHNYGWARVRKNSNSKKILIIGGGIGGLTAALSLRHFNMECVVFEQSPSLDEIGAGIQLSPNAMCVFAALGLDKDILRLGVEPDTCHLRDFRTGRLELSFPFKGFFEKRYGAKYVHIHRADLHHILTQKAKAENIDIHLGTRIVGYEQTSETICAIGADGKKHKGSLLIGADGIQSAIGAHMHTHNLQSPTPQHHAPQFAGQIAWRGIVPAEKIPHSTLEEIKNCVTNWMGPRQHFVSYFLRQGALVNFVAIAERANWTHANWYVEGDMAQLRSAFADWHAPVQEIIAACDRCSLWGLYARPPLPHWHDGRAVLLGDACHPMLPFMAQGAAMAIEDGYLLAKKLAEQSIKTNIKVTHVLQNYQSARKPRTSRVQKISRNNARLFHAHTRFARAIRQFKFKLARTSPCILVMVFALYMDRIYKKNVTRTD